MNDSFAYGPEAAPKKPRRFRRRAATFGIALAAFTAATLVLAAWTTSGAGNGRSRAGAMQALTISPGTVTCDGLQGETCLFPGSTGDLHFEVTNPNTRFDVSILTITQSGPSTSDAPLCNSAEVTAVQAVLDAEIVGAVIPAGGSFAFDVEDAAAMSGAANNDCQGATFLTPLSLTASSV